MKTNDTLTIIQTVLIILKLTDLIDWSWWYVTMPIWGMFALVIVVAAFFSTVEYFRQPKKTPDEIIYGRPRKKSKFQERLEEMSNQRNNK
jgi:uncharacterized membrane protein